MQSTRRCEEQNMLCPKMKHIMIKDEQGKGIQIGYYFIQEGKG